MRNKGLFSSLQSPLAAVQLSLYVKVGLVLNYSFFTLEILSHIQKVRPFVLAVFFVNFSGFSVYRCVMRRGRCRGPSVLHIFGWSCRSLRASIWSRLRQPCGCLRRGLLHKGARLCAELVAPDCDGWISS